MYPAFRESLLRFGAVIWSAGYPFGSYALQCLYLLDLALEAIKLVIRDVVILLVGLELHSYCGQLRFA